MLLTGTYDRALDDKFRLALPKRFRELLASSFSGGEGRTLFLTPGTDGSLALYAGPAFARMAEKLAAQSPTAQDVRAFGRLLYAQSQSVELDGQGRIRIPPELLRHASLARECVLIGVGDHIELWDKGRWEAYLSREQPRYDELAESALGGVAPVQPSGSRSSVTEEKRVTEDTVARPLQPR
jgi:MraZ protein